MGLRDRLKGLLKTVVVPGGSAAPSAPSRAPVSPAPRSETVPSPTSSASTPVSTEENWKALAPSSQVTEGKAGTFAIGSTDQVVAVFRYEGRLYAMDNACAHEDGPIGEGAIRGARVQCPYHDWEYDFTTGACLTDPERRQTCWKIREEGGTIFLGPVARQGTATRGGEHNDGMEVIVK